MNHVLLIGRLVRIPELRKTETGKNVTNITLAISRAFKDTNGEYQTDFIDCIVWENAAEKVITYCKKGDLIGIKGRLQVSKEENDKIKFNVIQVVTERLTMLSHPQIKNESEKNENNTCNNIKKEEDENEGKNSERIKK